MHSTPTLDAQQWRAMFYCLLGRVTRTPKSNICPSVGDVHVCKFGYSDPHTKKRVVIPLSIASEPKYMNEPQPLQRLYDQSTVSVRWIADSSVAGDYKTALGTVSVHHGWMESGKSKGLEVCVVDTGAAVVVILPGRGMSIWQIHAGEIAFGWKSPVDGPVSPSLVPIHDPSGLGWLEGFDELVVRCGLESNGAPEHADDGSLRYPLHGRIGNLPATDLRVEVNATTGELAIIGDVIESKLFFKRLRLRARVALTAGSTDVLLVDEVTNELSTPATVQMLYHVNVGTPILGEGARVVAPLQRLAPKDELSASEIECWNDISAPQSGYRERVYFASLCADGDGQTATMIRNAQGDAGLGVTFNTRTLPYFILWKNTADEADGYVVGLEPATNFPNARTKEGAQGRVVTLNPGERVTFQVGLHPLVTEAKLSYFQSRINTLTIEQETEIKPSPDPNWSV